MRLSLSRVALGMLLPLVLSLAACRVERNPVAQTVNPDSASKVVIRATMVAYQAALLANNPRAIAAFYAPDGRLYEPDAPDIVGLSEVRSAMSDAFDSGRVLTDVTLEAEDIHVDGPVAFEMGTFEERFRTGNGGEEMVRRGRYVIRWRRGAEAQWRIDRFLRNHLPADSATLPADSAALPAGDTVAAAPGSTAARR
jgi:ketosteroid isomerase-like protein